MRTTMLSPTSRSFHPRCKGQGQAREPLDAVVLISILQCAPQIAARVEQQAVRPPEGDHALGATWSRISPFIRYALLASHEALAGAKWSPESKGERERAGAFIGTGIGCLEEVVDAWRTLYEPGRGGYRRLSPHFVPKILGNLATGNVSIRYGLEGPTHASITACASGAHAIGDSYRLIKYGDADLMVTGGTEACVNGLALAGFGRLRALSTRFNDEPTR
jgi:3-oxoacyl-[acyl-carrier-protein] synthase II